VQRLIVICYDKAPPTDRNATVEKSFVSRKSIVVFLSKIFIHKDDSCKVLEQDVTRLLNEQQQQECVVIYTATLLTRVKVLYYLLPNECSRYKDSYSVIVHLHSFTSKVIPKNTRHWWTTNCSSPMEGNIHASVTTPWRTMHGTHIRIPSNLMNSRGISKKVTTHKLEFRDPNIKCRATIFRMRLWWRVRHEFYYLMELYIWRCGPPLYYLC